jgi:hypothetical protein
MYKISIVSTLVYLLILVIFTRVTVSNEDSNTTIINDLDLSTIDLLKNDAIFNLVVAILVLSKLISYSLL